MRRGHCPAHQHVGYVQRQQRGHAWYKTAAWQRLRLEVLTEEPFCRRGCGRLSTQVDHRQPHRGDRDLFFDRANLQGLCDSCHAAKSRAERLT